MINVDVVLDNWMLVLIASPVVLLAVIVVLLAKAGKK